MFEIIEELSYDLKKYVTREAGLLFNSLQTLALPFGLFLPRARDSWGDARSR